jgi:hypothetical protein
MSLANLGLPPAAEPVAVPREKQAMAFSSATSANFFKDNAGKELNGGPGQGGAALAGETKSAIVLMEAGPSCAGLGERAPALSHQAENRSCW